MSTLSGDFYGFDDLFPQGFLQGSFHSQQPDEDTMNTPQQRVQYRNVDSVLIAPDEYAKKIALIVHDSTHPTMHGVGISLTIAQATRVIALLRDCIHHVEHEEYIVEEEQQQHEEEDDQRPLDDRL